jgi:hypothetical protein
MTDQAPGNSPDPTPGAPAPAGGTGGTGGAPSGGTDWEGSYKGLQTTYNKLKETSDKSILDTTQKLTEAKAALEEAKLGHTTKDSQMAALTKQVTDLNNQMIALQGGKATIEGDLARAKLIMNDFPELAKWEAKGLIAKGKDEAESKQLLTQFRETLAGQLGVDLKNLMSGATPPGSGNTDLGNQGGNAGDESEDFVWKKLMETMGRNPKEAAQWQAKWDAIQAKKAQPKP